MKLYSDIFSTAEELYCARTQSYERAGQAIQREQIVRNFVNMLPTLSEDEAEEMGRTEITNFGSALRAAVQFTTPLEALVVGVNSPIEIEVDTNSPRIDALLGVRLANVFNDVITSSDEWYSTWRAAVGHGFIRGGAPLVYDREDMGLFPELRRDLVFPAKTPLSAASSVSAFARVHLSLEYLDRLLLEAKDDKDINEAAVQALVSRLKGNLKARGSDTDTSDSSVQLDDVDESVRDESTRDNYEEASASLDGYRYYEVRRDKKGHDFVSTILFVDNEPELSKEDVRNGKKVDTKAGNAKKNAEQNIILQTEKALDSPREWLKWLVLDEEVGSVKTTSTLRGTAEAFYPAAVEFEELRNLQLEGEKIKAKPKFFAGRDTDPDRILDVDLVRDTFINEDFEEVNWKHSSAGLNPIITSMAQEVAGISGATYSNTSRDQELRQQAVNRQQANSAILSNRAKKALRTLDQIYTSVVCRGLTIEPDEKDHDYEDISFIQDTALQAIIETLELDENSDEDVAAAEELLKKLTYKKNGRFKHIKVTAKRGATGVDRDSEIEQGNFILEAVNGGRVPSQLVPEMLQTAFALLTGDADMAQKMAPVAKAQFNEQRRLALLEWSAVQVLATSGQPLETAPSDDHVSHAEGHVLTLQGHINRHQLRPWDQLDIAYYAGLSEHLGAHIAEVQRRPEFKGAIQALLLQAQEVNKVALDIVQEVQAQQQSSQEEPSIEMMERLQKIKESEARVQKIGNDIALAQRKAVDLEAQRESRQRNNSRQLNLAEENFRLKARDQAFKEVDSDRQFLDNQP